ncbi:MAG: M20/M25/M40 family metallo-hydrolase [Candidatus Freyarchaeota archaeon]|nr:M20/M25/M40 family metallo-hydrolase [Candidatus Jordarchaeia archaeon]MBS7267307.1 M20/M25/M40 family metallo-hydrolase [Candidatus Jordarchaeia archaeon]MBS7278261.1 M20/M25/M40 family metallo-hydrolase [Candidatus Jordarchaeia archaeon]
MVSLSKMPSEIKEFIEYFCDEVGPRPPCSEQEAKAARLMKKKFDEYCDKTSLENFTCRPAAYRWVFRLPIILYILSVALYVVSTYFSLQASATPLGFALPPSIWGADLRFYHLLFLLAAIAVSTFSIVIIVGSLMYTKETVDLLFPKRTSTNVIGKIKPQEKAKKLVLISGHHDSNWEFPLIKKFGSKYVNMQAIPVILNYVLLPILLLKMATHFLGATPSFHTETTILAVLVAPIPIMLYIYPNLVSKTPVMGANDNLTGMAVCYEVAKYISNPELRPKETEVWLVSFGCEEIGDRGSKQFVKSHYEELKEAYHVNIDMVGEKESTLCIVEKEVRTLVKLSPEVTQKLNSIFEMLRIKAKNVSIDAYTDAMSFAKKGLKSASIVALGPSKFPKYYHTTNDTPENLDYNQVANVVKVCLEFIKQIDQKA